MIQRIQTVYLLIGALILGGFFSFTDIWVDWVQPVGSMLPWLLLVWGGVTALAGLGSIFLYNNRQLQRRAVLITQWMTVVFVAALYSVLVAVDRLGVVVGGQASTSNTIALLFPLAAYVLFYLARRGIEKDIEKVRSVDRLR